MLIGRHAALPSTEQGIAEERKRSSIEREGERRGLEGERRSEGAAAPLARFSDEIGWGRDGKALWIHGKIVNQRPLGPVRAID